MIAANYDIHIGILSVITGEILSNRQCVTNIIIIIILWQQVVDFCYYVK